jgi:phosphoesterase RecJ-like protein
MKLKAIDCAILVREEEGKVRLSLRSKAHYDVNKLASELFGGGGHKRAAGATSTVNLQETVRIVKQKLNLED